MPPKALPVKKVPPPPSSKPGAPTSIRPGVRASTSATKTAPVPAVRLAPRPQSDANSGSKPVSPRPVESKPVAPNLRSPVEPKPVSPRPPITSGVPRTAPRRLSSTVDPDRRPAEVSTNGKSDSREGSKNTKSARIASDDSTDDETTNGKSDSDIVVGAGARFNAQYRKSMVIYDDATKEQYEQVKFMDSEGRQVTFELTDTKVLRFYVSGRVKVQDVATVYVEDGNVFHMKGRAVTSSESTATVPDHLDVDEIVFGVMELFARRAQENSKEQRLIVSLVSARGLRDADENTEEEGVSDPYCIASILGKPESRMQTKFVKDTLNPEWNHIGEISGWVPGDMLVFDVWDKDWCSRDDYLGHAELALQDANNLPQWEGELKLSDAGPGVSAYLKVVVQSGTRVMRAANQVLDCLEDTSIVIDRGLLEKLLPSAKEVGIVGGNVEKGECLLKLMRARATNDPNQIRSALTAAQLMGLDVRPEFHEAVKFVSTYDAMEQLRQAERDLTLMALEEALESAKQAECSASDLKRYEQLAMNVKMLAEAGGSSDLNKRNAAVQLAYHFELTQWKEFKPLAMKCLQEATKNPMLAELEQAVKVGQDIWAEDRLLNPCRKLLAAMQRLDATVKSKKGRFKELHEAILNVKDAAGRSDVDSPEIAEASSVLKDIAKKTLDDALLTPSTDSLSAAIKDAGTAQLGEKDTVKAKNILKALESLSAALKSQTADGLRVAIEMADSRGLPQDSSQYISAKSQLEALETLKTAKDTRRKTHIAKAIDKAQEAGLSASAFEFGEDGKEMKRLWMERQLLDAVKKATKVAQLDQALEAAKNFNLGDRPEVKEGKTRLLQLRAYEELIEATSAAVPNVRNLREALETVRACGLDDEASCPIAEARRALHAAKVMLAKENGRDQSRERLKEASVSLTNFDPIELAKAIKDCKDVELPQAEYNRAEELLRALKMLHALATEEDPEKIRKVLEDSTVIKLREVKEYKQAAERLKVKDEQRKIKQMQQRVLDMLEEALSEDTQDALRKAIKEAKKANIEERFYAKHVAQLKKLEEREKELKRQAESRLKEAMKSTATIETLQQALKNAELVKLDPGNATYREAGELLVAKKDALRQLTNSFSEKTLARAIANAQKYGLENTPEYREAKSQLAKSRELSLKTQHAENARKQLEAAIESPVTRAGLERAIRAGRVVQIQNTEPLMMRALQLLKEIMQLEVVQLANKITAGLANKTLNRERYDVMNFVKEEINSCTSAAKMAGVADSDLEDLVVLRKRIHNIVEDLKGSIRVFVRVRPLSKKETNQGDINIVQQLDPMSLEIAQMTQDMANQEKMAKFQFQYDSVFTPGSQEQVFADCKELVQSVLDGYNVTIFAYGQTGAGKTYTMAGEPGNEGIGPRTIDELFRVMNANKFRCTYSVKASLMELYCNDFTDLLRPPDKKDAKKIEVKWHEKEKEVVVENCLQEIVTDAASLHNLLARGTLNRKTAPTLMNAESSRSHLIFTIYVSGVHKDTNEKFKGKVVTVDLAGCERLKKSGAAGQQQTEAIEINKSLTALVDVIEALVSTQAHERKDAKQGKVGKASFIPYRNHHLTQLLQDSLGGTSKALMFVNCSPAASNCQETVAALRYGQRAKNVTNIKVGAMAGDGEVPDDVVGLLRAGDRGNQKDVHPEVEDDATVKRKLQSAKTADLLDALGGSDSD